MGINKPVPGFNKITTLDNTDLFHVIHNNVDKRMTWADLKLLIPGPGDETIIEYTAVWVNQIIPDLRNVIYEINASDSSPKSLNLNSTPQAGDTVTIVDKKGDAATNNVMIFPATGTILGASNILLNINNQSYTLKYDGAAWIII